MDLIDIQPSVQKIADAIAAVLKIEVEIANHHFIRVAGTGQQKTSILHKMEGDLVYQSAIRTGGPIIIENPGYELVCERCVYYKNCNETGEICTPITYEGNVIGVIGLLAFNEEQKKRLFESTDEILTFLNKMANLIATKLHEHEMIEQLTKTSEKLSKIMNLVNQGIIVVNNHGEIHNINEKAKSLLGMDDDTSLSSQTKMLLSLLVKNEEISQETIKLSVKSEEKSFFLVKQNISNLGKKDEYLLIIQSVDEIEHLAERAAEEQRKPFSQIIGVSPQMKELKDYAFKVSNSNSTILIQGESGTGKEEFAKAIHFSSPRKEHPFITVNCGAIPDTLLESELFGYEKGAFTGANNNGKQGKFELAHNGTIFLDEIGEMPSLLQVKLLRVIQEREIERLGGSKPIPVNVRIIAATNRNLQSMVDKGDFREDLYFRLNVIPMFIPSLRNRKEDILKISDHLIAIYNKSFSANVLGFEKEVQQLMLNYSWPGNVRELKNFIEYLFNFISEGWITIEKTGDMIRRKLNLHKSVSSEEKRTFSLKEMEREMIKKALKHVDSMNLNIEDASKLLGVSRATLFRKIKKYQIEI